MAWSRRTTLMLLSDEKVEAVVDPRGSLTTKSVIFCHFHLKSIS